MSLPPIKMTPAYRFGAATPWGGDGLARVFGKSIPDARTGEALEVSAIPGLESRDASGTPLPMLIVRHGAALTGTAVCGAFPLLLKLLDARDTLSVQVHPNDDYAARVEQKLGKTEAWVILRAELDARLIYGVQPGTTRAQLREASMQGAAVEKCLRSVAVRAGETYFIPSGMVHAIGKGILLYEIQQSSDVTYRFYDWERRGRDGRKRALHLDKALDVTDVGLCPNAVQAVMMQDDSAGCRERLLDTPYFGLERLKRCRSMAFWPDTRRFSILTALSDGDITWQSGAMRLKAGETALLPADGFTLSLTGPEYLLAYPTVR